MDRMQTKGPRDPDQRWLDRFREVEPTAELLDLGNGFWLLGSFRFDVRAAKVGLKMLRHHLRLDDRYIRPSVLRKAHAIMEGFRPICMYTDHELYSGIAFTDLRVRDYNWRTRPLDSLTEGLDGVTKIEQDRREEAKEKEYALMARELAPWICSGRTRGVRVTANLN